MKTAIRELTVEELGHVSGGKLSSENPGGKPHGASQINSNQGGNQPPGQNKNLPPSLQ
jgi:hypothetical protein